MDNRYELFNLDGTFHATVSLNHPRYHPVAVAGSEPDDKGRVEVVAYNGKRYRCRMPTR